MVTKKNGLHSDHDTAPIFKLALLLQKNAWFMSYPPT
jgi:hypothetical protein